MNSYPFVSVIIVNYNGAHFLTDCIRALENQTYPREAYEIVVSDNGSSDGSVELLRTNFPKVRVVKNRKNLGFAAGNNIAIQNSTAKYVALINNDTAANTTWLENLVACAEENPSVGIVTGRSQLFYNQLVLDIESDSCNVENDPRELGIQIYRVETGAKWGVVQYLDGFYSLERYPDRQFRWTSGHASLGIPVQSGNGDFSVTFCLGAGMDCSNSVRVKISIDGTVIDEFEVMPDPQEFKLQIPAVFRKKANPLVQNAGSLVDRNGYGRDRGTYVRNFEVFFETDEDQYGKLEEIFAACGTNMLVRKSMIDSIGAFDGRFFAYYEDTDLSWRAWLGGWKVYYCPSAIIRHIHCGTSKEWSPLFTFLVERNRLAMLLKNGMMKQAVDNWAKYFLFILKMGLGVIADLDKGKRDQINYRLLLIRLKVLFSLFIWFPRLIVQRWGIQRKRKIDSRVLGQKFSEL